MVGSGDRPSRKPSKAACADCWRMVLLVTKERDGGWESRQNQGGSCISMQFACFLRAAFHWLMGSCQALQCF